MLHDPRTKPRHRPYLTSGVYRWKPPSPEEEHAMAEERDAIIRDKGGLENLTTLRLHLIDLYVAERWKYERTGRYLLTLPDLVDKRHRRLWQVVRDHSALGVRVQNLALALGLDPEAKPVADLRSYIGEKSASSQRKKPLDGARSSPWAPSPRSSSS